MSMPKPKPTPAPKTPALVRGGALAIAFGVGMHGLACGGTELESQGSGSSEAGDGSDAEPDAITFLPDSGSHDAQADHVILVPPPPR
jgi:hypothetical protein